MSGFPWNLISFSFSEFLPLLQILSLIGTYSFNLFCITLFVLPSLFYLKKNKYEIYFVVFIWFIINFWSFIWSTKSYKIKKMHFLKDNNFIIKIISPKIGIERFYYTENEEEILESLIKIKQTK